MTENKQEFKIMTADIQHLTQSAEWVWKDFFTSKQELLTNVPA